MAGRTTAGATIRLPNPLIRRAWSGQAEGDCRPYLGIGWWRERSGIPTATDVHGRFRHRLQLAQFLYSFPSDVLKIDRSFVGRMAEGDQPLQIVRTIIELARVLNIDRGRRGHRDPRTIPIAE